MRRLLCSLVLAAAAVTACGGDGSNDPKASLAGVYNLSTVDGHGLPYILYDDGTLKAEALRGTFTITGNGTYTENIALRLTDSGVAQEVPAVCSGTYTKSGNNLALTETETDDCGGSWTAVWDGRNTITVDYGRPVVYKR
jgi:hypothetical protein